MKDQTDMKVFCSFHDEKESLFLIGDRVFRVQKKGNDLKFHGIFHLPTEIKGETIKDIQLMPPKEYQEFSPAMIITEQTDGSMNYSFVQYNIEIHGDAELINGVVKDGLDAKFKAAEQITSGKVAKDTKSIPVKQENGRWSVYFVDDAKKELN